MQYFAIAFKQGAPNMNSFRYIVLGGGMVAGYAAREIVERGLGHGELAIVSSDDALPYERPPLSKGFLAGNGNEEGIFINDAAFYGDHGIDLRLGTVIDKIDFDGRTLHTRNGDAFRFEKLLIATGAVPRHFEVPGADLDGLLYLRSLDDSKTIRRRASAATNAVIAGSGFIGMEVAAVFAHKGIPTTMVFPEERVWRRLFSPEMSEYFERYFEARGVTFERKVTIRAFGGRERVESVLAEDGREIAADLVVAGIGATPATTLFEGTGLKLSNGIVVNEYLETNIQDVWAAGDVANYRDALSGGFRRVEHWDNAVKQGQHAARALLGTHKPFENVPYFFSDVFDLSWEFWGDPADADRAVIRGDVAKNSFSVWWLKQGCASAAFVLRRPDEERESAEQWVREHHEVSPVLLADASRPLR